MVDKDRQNKGKRARRLGAAFEVKARKFFEAEGWIVDKWSNNIDLQTDEICKAKARFINGRPLGMGSGFPDFVMFRKINVSTHKGWIRNSKGEIRNFYDLRFVECKTNNILSKEEKLKMNAMLDKGFDCYIAGLVGKEVKIRRFLRYEDKT